jgi:hypothetical protein
LTSNSYLIIYLISVWLSKNYTNIRIKDKQNISEFQELYFGNLFSLLFDKLRDEFRNKNDLFFIDNEKEFIQKIFEKSNLEQLEITEESKWLEEKKRIIIEDLSFCVKVIYIYLNKFVFSTIYPFFLNEKNFQKFFTVNLNLYRKTYLLL